jgi:hypothetical protein
MDRSLYIFESWGQSLPKPIWDIIRHVCSSIPHDDLLLGMKRYSRQWNATKISVDLYL